MEEQRKQIKKAPKAVGSQATPEVIQSWVVVYDLYQKYKGERRERLQQVADHLGVTLKIAKRRMRNYEAMKKVSKK